MEPKVTLKFKWLLLVIMFGLIPVSTATAATKTTPVDTSSNIFTMEGRQMTIELAPEVINRVHGPEPIKKINAPKALALEVEYQGNDAFIIIGKKAKPGVIYVATQTGEVFTIEIIPNKKMKARVINLDASKNRARSNRVKFSKIDRETAAVELIQNAFADTIPDNFNVAAKSNEIKAIKNLKIIHRRAISIDGVPLRLNEYLVGIAPFSGVSLMPVVERTFLVPKLTRTPVAIALGRDLARFEGGKVFVRRGRHVRLFIVEQIQE